MPENAYVLPSRTGFLIAHPRPWRSGRSACPAWRIRPQNCASMCALWISPRPPTRRTSWPISAACRPMSTWAICDNCCLTTNGLSPGAGPRLPLGAETLADFAAFIMPQVVTRAPGEVAARLRPITLAAGRSPARRLTWAVSCSSGYRLRGFYVLRTCAPARTRALPARPARRWRCTAVIWRAEVDILLLDDDVAMASADHQPGGWRTFFKPAGGIIRARGHRRIRSSITDGDFR